VKPYHNGARKRVVEPLNQLNDSTLPASRRTDESNVRSRFDSEIEMPKHTNGRTSGVAEVNILELNSALDVIDYSAFCGLGVDFWTVIEQLDNLSARNVGFGNVRDEGEDVASLDSSECDTLYTMNQSHEPTP
jgi:hypothetical protein